MINAQCPQGHRLQVPDKYAGKRIRCPKCKEAIAIPAATLDDDDFDDLIAEDEERQKRKRAAAKRKAAERKAEAAAQAEVTTIPTWALWTAGGVSGLLLTSIAVWLMWPASQSDEPLADRPGVAVTPPGTGQPAGRPGSSESSSSEPQVAATKSGQRVAANAKGTDSAGAAPNLKTMKANTQSTKREEVVRKPVGANGSTVVSEFAMPRAIDSSGQLMELPHPMTAAALESDTGQIAIVDLASAQLSVLRPAWFAGDKTQMVGPVDLPPQPTGVTFKKFNGKRHLVVSCMDRELLTILDPETLRVTRQIVEPEMGVGLRLVTGSENPLDPYVWVAGKGKERDGVFSVHLDAEKPALVPLPDAGTGSYALGAVPSVDGKFVYTYGRVLIAWSVTAGDRVRVTPSVVRRSKKKEADRTVHPTVLLNRIIYRDTEQRIGLVDLATKRKSRCSWNPIGPAFGGRCFAAIQDDELHLVSTGGLQSLATVELPEAIRPVATESPAIEIYGRNFDLRTGHRFFHNEFDNQLAVLSNTHAWTFPRDASMELHSALGAPPPPKSAFRTGPDPWPRDSFNVIDEKVYDAKIDKTFKFTEPISAAAYDRKSGNLLVSNHSFGGFLAYNMDKLSAGDVAQVAEFKTRGEPNAVCCFNWNDRTLFAIHGNTRLVSSSLVVRDPYNVAEPSYIRLIDAATLEVVKTIRVEPTTVQRVTKLRASRDPAKPFLYLVGRDRADRKATRDYTCRINLETGQLDDKVTSEEAAKQILTGVGSGPAIERAGTARAKAKFRIQDSFKSGMVVGAEYANDSRSSRDAGSKMWSAQVVLGDPNTHEVLAKCSIPHASGHFRSEAYKFIGDNQSAAAARAFDEGYKSALKHRFEDRNASRFTLPRAYADDDRNLVFTLSPDSLSIYPVDQLMSGSAPPAALIGVTATPPSRVVAGKEVRVPISIEGGVDELTVSPAVDGNPRIENGEFVWTPPRLRVEDMNLRLTESNLNLSQTFELSATKASATRKWKWKFYVESPSLKVPFAVAGGAIRADGEVAFLWGPNPKAKADDESGLFTIATYGIKSEKILEQKVFDKRLAIAAIDEKHVYAMAYFSAKPEKQESRKRELIKLDARRLRPVASEEVAVSGNQLTVVNGAYLLLEANRSSVVLDAKSLKVQPRNSRSQAMRKLPNGWLVQGLVWDREFKKPQLLLNPGGQVPRRANWRLASQDVGFQNISSERGGNRIPILTQGSRSTKNLTRQPLSLLQSTPKYDGPPTLSTAFDSILATAGGAAFVIPRDEPRSDRFRIEPKQSEFVLGTKRATNVKYKGNAQATWTLAIHIASSMRDQPLYSGQSPDGSFKVAIKDTRWLLQYAANTLPKEREKLLEYRESLLPVFRAVARKAPSGIPFAVPATVTAKTETSSETQSHYYYVELPVEAILKAGQR